MQEKTITVELLGDTFIVSEEGETFNITDKVKSWAKKINLKNGDKIKININNGVITNLTKLKVSKPKQSYNKYNNKSTYNNNQSEYMKPRHPIDQKEIKKSIALQHAVALVSNIYSEGVDLKELVKEYYTYFLELLEKKWEGKDEREAERSF